MTHPYQRTLSPFPLPLLTLATGDHWLYLQVLSSAPQLIMTNLLTFVSDRLLLFFPESKHPARIHKPSDTAPTTASDPQQQSDHERWSDRHTAPTTTTSPPLASSAQPTNEWPQLWTAPTTSTAAAAAESAHGELGPDQQRRPAHAAVVAHQLVQLLNVHLVLHQFLLEQQQQWSASLHVGAAQSEAPHQPAAAEHDDATTHNAATHHQPPPSHGPSAAAATSELCQLADGESEWPTTAATDVERLRRRVQCRRRCSPGPPEVGAYSV